MSHSACRRRVQTRDRLPFFFRKEQVLPEMPQVISIKPLVIASDSIGDNAANHLQKSATFNGKIDGLKIETIPKGRVESLLNLGSSLDVPSDEVRDVSGKRRHGTLVNAPARAVIGHDRDASQNDWTRASYGYGAKDLHDDDVDDAA